MHLSEQNLYFQKWITVTNSRFKALPLFEEYLRVGYYPFYQENSNLYYKQLQEVINME
ncbi:hypothetical protein [Flavobacterium circumlabens]|uniref:Uncharacterized protein n=1 Tax=Flavobacterium circumlabens TaxID=2133765 RepID=A0ABY2ARY7_9FLAO|nr:hypothetical protein [Flavobacterium circumlabens]TCN50702.1 hypothetical protein EV142_11441 [Flavobacterium circumlabens]